MIINTALDHIRSTKKYSKQIMLEEEVESKYDNIMDMNEYNKIDTERLYHMIDSLPSKGTQISFNIPF